MVKKRTETNDEFDKVEFLDDKPVSKEELKEAAEESAPPEFWNEQAASKTFNEAVKANAEDIANLVIRKQRDYGPANIMNSVVSPELAIAVRLNDKIARLVNLAKSGVKPNNESLLDTADDIMGYGMILKLVLSGEFTLPLEDE